MKNEVLYVVIFDGVCNLCNSSLNLLIKLDKKERLHFAHIGSKFYLEMIAKNNQLAAIDSVFFVKKGVLYTESNAIIEILRTLEGGYKLAAVLYIFPKFIRNLIYRIISKNRYAFFGRSKHCIVPDEALVQRFLD